MEVVWHEGALGDLLLSRLAVAHLAKTLRSPRFFARNEARRLLSFLMREVYSTEILPKTQPERLYAFCRSESVFNAVKELLSPKEALWIRTVPEDDSHVAMFQLREVNGLLREEAKVIPFRREERVVLIHPGSGSESKRYSKEGFVELCRGLKERSVDFKVILGPAEVELKEAFRDFPLTVSYDLETALEELSRCKLFVGNDSGLSHLAAACGVPTIALFQTTDPRVWAPFGGRVRVLYPAKRLSPDELLEEVLKPFQPKTSFLTTSDLSLLGVEVVEVRSE